jgi:hypothetical protein
MPHKGAYPFEEIQLGHPSKRDAGQAYLPIEDIKDIKDYVPHPFDAHPVHRHADAPHHELLPEHQEAIKSGITGWDTSPHHQQWLKDEETKAMANPEAYENAGKTKPSHVYEGVPLSMMPHHSAAPAEAKPEESKVTESKPKSVQMSPEDIASLPESLRRKYGL